MGYFSEIDVGERARLADSHYHGFEEQLLWRYESLKDRYRELAEGGAPYTGDDLFTAKEYRYDPIEYFKTLKDVFNAMTVAKEDLKRKCGIVLPEELEDEEEDGDGEDGDLLMAIVLLPSWFQTAAAAA